MMKHDEHEPEPVDPADLADVLDGLAQAKRREFASNAEIEAAFACFGPLNELGAKHPWTSS